MSTNVLLHNLFYYATLKLLRMIDVSIYFSWTLENGYNKASNSVLQCAFEDAKNYGKQLLVGSFMQNSISKLQRSLLLEIFLEIKVFA